jgi:O-antigen/teichoic acid export membrane protein
VLGTGLGIVLMLLGNGALVGVLCQLGGMLGAFVIASVWVFRSAGVPRAARLPRSRTPVVLRAQGMGMSSMLMSAGYVAAPIIIVSAVAPIALPVYAIVDKVQRQVSVALNPMVTVFQGWVPRASGERLRGRVGKALTYSALFTAGLGVLMYVGAPYVILWLGGAQIRPSQLTLVLMSVFVAVNMFESVVSKAVMVAIERVHIVATATLAGSIVGLPLVALGAVFFGAGGALAGILSGLLVRLGIQLFSIARFMGHRTSTPLATHNEEPEREYL